MNHNSPLVAESARRAGEGRPILLVTYMWIGDFVRSHSVVRVLRERWPERPIDMLTSSLCAPLIDYMPSVRKGIICDLPRGRLPVGRYLALGRRLRAEGYGTALVMLRTWKAALAPFLAGIPERTGFVGEGRFGLINDLRWGERRLERMIDCMGALALPKGAALPTDWPLPNIVVPPGAVAAWLAHRELALEPHPIVALAPGAVGRGKRWSTRNYAQLARQLAEAATSVWVLGGPNERALAREIVATGGTRVRDLTGNDLRDAVIALTAVDAAVTNDSGLMHIAAAIGTPTVALFGPTSPRLWAPLNPLAAAIEPAGDYTDIRQRDVDAISASTVFEAVTDTLAKRG